jgi:hypothetical protein
VHGVPFYLLFTVAVVFFFNVDFPGGVSLSPYPLLVFQSYVIATHACYLLFRVILCCEPY